jgi:hypothetical protein
MMNYNRTVVFLVFMLVMAGSLVAQTWKNPFTLSGEIDGGIGDPYILKYRGIYYLYGSNRQEQALRCWSSKDLVNWSDSIICSTDERIKLGWAPEVFYWNGMFYMYASPDGKGHYALASESPTGPFTAVSGNLGKKIDGSIFIDDDARWYFYHANAAGILGCEMPTPTSVGESVNLNTQMDGQWTEAPCVIKRNGIYYLIYTGNHLKSPGYRVDYAKNTTGPIDEYTPQITQNPILINTEGDFVGLGHGTAFIGPDLDTYYFAYHNIVNLAGGSHFRKFNFDRMAWNGDKLMMLGHTNWEQQAPQRATSDYFNRMEIGSDWLMPNGGNWGIHNQDYLFHDAKNEPSETGYKAIFNAATAPDYTAEFTIKEITQSNNSGRLGAVFSYANEQNYGVALFHSATNRVEINFRINGVWGVPQFVELSVGFNSAVWHSIRVEKYAATYKFFVDGLLKSTLISKLEGGHVGYMTSKTRGNFSYIAFSSKVNGSGIFDTYKPIPGTIAAVHYNTGENGVGYQDLTSGNAGGQYIRKDSVDISSNPLGGYHLSGIQAGEWYKYNVNVQSGGTYHVGIKYAYAGTTSRIRIKQGETDLCGVVELPTTGDMGNWQVFTIKGLNLNSGYQTLKIEVVSGDFNFYEMQFKHADNERITKTDSFESTFSPEWNYSDGDWKIEAGEATIDGYGKRVMGNSGWSDYTIEADITYKNAMNAGIIFRVNNPAQGGANNNSALGTNFLQGYSVGLDNSSVTLGKYNYNWTLLKTAPGSYALNKSYHIKIVTFGANIKVYVDDMVTPKIDYTDNDPFISGKVGFRSCNAHVHYDNFKVSTANNLETDIK